MSRANMADDPRIDPRIKAVFANLDLGPSADVQNRPRSGGILASIFSRV